MNLLRGAGLAVLLLVAVTFQAAVLHYLAVDGVVPNLALLLVVAAALLRGSEYAAVLGFVAGLVLDLAPPADHVAGRWALALVVAGYLAGRVRLDARSSMVAALVTVGACSFVATSVYALSGWVVGDDHLAAGEMIKVILVGVVWDVLVAPLVLPVCTAALRRLQPPKVAW